MWPRPARPRRSGSASPFRKTCVARESRARRRRGCSRGSRLGMHRPMRAMMGPASGGPMSRPGLRLRRRSRCLGHGCSCCGCFDNRCPGPRRDPRSWRGRSRERGTLRRARSLRALRCRPHDGDLVRPESGAGQRVRSFERAQCDMGHGSAARLLHGLHPHGAVHRNPALDEDAGLHERRLAQDDGRALAQEDHVTHVSLAQTADGDEGPPRFTDGDGQVDATEGEPDPRGPPDGGRKRSPTGDALTLPPCDPRGTPHVSRYPYPPEVRVQGPASIVKGSPAPGLVRYPGPARVVGVDPSSGRVGPPSGRHVARDPDLSVRRQCRPRAEWRQSFAEVGSRGRTDGTRTRRSTSRSRSSRCRGCALLSVSRADADGEAQRSEEKVFGVHGRIPCERTAWRTERDRPVRAGRIVRSDMDSSSSRSQLSASGGGMPRREMGLGSPYTPARSNRGAG
jgi:hypothetical protein